MPLSAVSSILVRITGIAVLMLTFLIVAWFITAATSESAFEVVNGLLTHWIGKVILLGSAWALFYHMLGRLRHVVWDFGKGLDLNASNIMAYVMFIGATVLTGITAFAL